MKHFDGGGCSLGDEHAGPCVFKDVNTKANHPVNKPVNKSQSVNKGANKPKSVNNAVNTCVACAEKDREIAKLKGSAGT